MESYKSTFLGSISGGLGYILTLPLDAIKQNIQTGKKINSSFKYFKGGMLGVTSIIPQMGIKFSTNTYMEKNHKFNPMINGFVAGLMDGAFLGPVLSLQSLQQMDNSLTYKKSLQLVKNPLQLCIPMALRNAFYTSVLLGGYRLIPDKKNTFMEDFWYASLLNIPGTIISCPYDVIRAKQNEFLLHNKNINVGYVCQEIYKDGFSGFFRGYKMLYINFALRFPLTLAIFNYLMNYKND